MSIETLNSAARAAGFAMATSEEPAEERKAEALESNAWRPGEAILLGPSDAAVTPAAPVATFAERVRSVFTFGRRAPA